MAKPKAIKVMSFDEMIEEVKNMPPQTPEQIEETKKLIAKLGLSGVLLSVPVGDPDGKA